MNLHTLGKLLVLGQFGSLGALMAALHPDYAQYQARTRWFIPYLL